MFTIRAGDEVYTALMETFEKADRPLNVAELMAHADVCTAVLARWDNDKVRGAELLSNRLAFMWKKGVLDRYNAPISKSFSRFSYGLKGKFGVEGEFEIIRPTTIPRKNKTLVPVPIAVSETSTGEVTIELEHFTITVRPK